ncbi:MAG: hypothetical protein EOO71_01290 [Myxococcaceae bacterium]|nr:MAG: hypothetical protein EOO71_01290 [Myxococcaceae bacterium]
MRRTTDRKAGLQIGTPSACRRAPPFSFSLTGWPRTRLGTRHDGREGSNAMSKDPSEQGIDASNANNFLDLFRSEVNPRTGKLQLSIVAPKLSGLGELDVDLGIDYTQGDGAQPKRVLGLPTRWRYRLSYIAGDQIIINGQQSYPVDARWPQGMKYYNLKDMRLETDNNLPALPHAPEQRYLNVLVFLNGVKQYFDLKGRLIETADAHGNHILYYYSSADAGVHQNTLQRIVDTHGQSITFDCSDTAIQITLPETGGSSPRLRYELNAAGELVSYQDPAGRKTTFTYGGGMMQRNLLSRVESPNQLVTTFAYRMIQSKKATGELRLDVVSELTRNFQATARTVRFNFDPDGNKQNYTGYPTYALSGQDSLLESGNNRYRYRTTVDDGITLTRHTYNNLHLELRTDVYSSSQPTDLISSTLYSYPDEGADQAFPAFNRLSAQYQRPATVEVRTYNPGNTQTFRSMKKETAYNDAGQLTSTTDFVAPDGVTFVKERSEFIRFDPRFGLMIEKDVHDARATGEPADPAIISRLSRTLTPTGSLVASSQLGFVTSGGFSPSHITKYEYDPQGRMTRQEYAWVEAGAKSPRSSSSQTSYRYDEKSHQLTRQETDAAGNSKGQVTDTVTGLVLSETDALGATTRFTYDALGRKTAAVDPLKATTRWTYDDATHTTTVQNANGYQSVLQNDGFGHLISQSDNAGPGGRKRVLYNRAYDAHGRLSKETGILGEAAALTYAYDSRGRLSQLTDGQGNIRSYAYDEVASSQTESFNGIQTRTLWFDDHQNIVKDESFGATSGRARVTSTGHDGNGRVVSTKLGSGRSATEFTRRITRDILGNELKTETRAGDGTTVIRLEDRDLFGNVTLTTKSLQLAQGSSSARGATHQYDATGRLTRTTNPLGKNESVTYDANGNVATWTDLAGTTFTHAYDALGALVSKKFTEANVKHKFEYTYEASTRRLLSLQHFADDKSLNKIEYTHSTDGKLTSTRYLPDDKHLRWEYSAETQQLVSFTDANGEKTRFSYTPNGQVRTVESAGGASNTLTFSYYSKKEDAANSGKVKTLASGSGLSVTYAYDDLGRISVATALAPVIAGTKTVAAIAYTYDETTGNITRRAFSSEHAPQESALNHQVSYQYNGIGQLTQEEDLDAKGLLLTRRSYTYDAAGNVMTRTLARTAATTETTTFQYDADNKLVSLRIQGGSERKLAYDLLGNLTNDGAGRQFSYNALGQLIGFVDGTTAKFSYTYQPDGLRESKRRAEETPVKFLYDQAEAPNIVNEIQGTKCVSHQQVGAVRFTRTVQGSDTESFIHDQGNVAASLLGQTLSAKRYSAYGELDSPPGVGTPGSFNLKDNPFGFAGEYRDSESGLCYQRARYYDPQLMRFLTRDSAALFNRYNYAAGNPVMLSDPSGNDPWWKWLTLGLALVVGVVATVATAGALGGAAAGFIAGASSLVAGATNAGIAVAAGVVGAIASNAVSAIGNSWGEDRWGAEQFFNKDLGISVGLGAVGSVIGSAVTTGGKLIAQKLIGETGRRLMAGRALAGLAGGVAESTFGGTTTQLASKGEVDWGIPMITAIGMGGLSGAAGEFSVEIFQFGKRLIPTRLQPFNARSTVDFELRSLRSIDAKLDVPIPFEAWTSPPGSFFQRLFQQGEGTPSPGTFTLFRFIP